jgi:hypothetical protein
MLWSPQKSLASHFMAWLGRRFIVAPEKIQAPANFYHEPGDRRENKSRSEALKPEVQRELIRVEAIRRGLFERVALLSSVFAFTICIAAMVIAGLVGGISKAVNGPVELTAREQMRCANLSAIAEQRRTPAQRSEFERKCQR